MWRKGAVGHKNGLREVIGPEAESRRITRHAALNGAREGVQNGLQFGAIKSAECAPRLSGNVRGARVT